MEPIKLVAVTKKYKTSVMMYRDEFIMNGDSMDGTAGLRACETFEVWENSLKKNSKKTTVTDGKSPATTLLAVTTKEDRLIGMVDIRHELTELLLNYGGHIGYSVRKCERQKGFATQILSEALKKCVDLKIKHVLVTCEKSNLASARTIIKNNGVLENEVLYENQTVIQRYYIVL